MLGCAQTGTGKTAAFAIPIIQQIYNDKKALKGKRTIKAVILAPTRELAIQIEENFVAYARHTNIKSLVIFGGVSQNPQVKALKEGVDILIATPGRMLDLYSQKFLKLNDVKHFVLDEADSMLDMGMIHDVKRIISHLPKVRQNIFFSATMPKEISKLADSIFKNPVKVEVAPVSSTTEMVDQNIYFVSKKQKTKLLIELLKNNPKESVLVFSRTKHGANKITKDLISSSISASAIHGNKSQNARQLALNEFKEGKIRVLVATDIAARGIDIDELPFVINYDLPEVAETYVHRIGRTGRAGRSGRATAFCSMEERDLYKAIEKLINKKIEVVENHSFVSSAEDVTVVAKRNNRGSRRPSRSNNKNNKNKDKFTNKK
ncbi:ATP-dependent RNA helicase RhlE [bioreactor metagenome]|uniref:ATP-dependent RNA helicase RhlE n=1 Tax=bioreactor metagenome TaxID=1076179 RepID=A0A645AQL9_9ZZZZ